MSALPIQPAQYDTLLDEKIRALRMQFSEFDLPELEVFASPTVHYRMRAEFRTWHEGDDLFYAMFAPGDNRVPIRISESLMVSERINTTMFELLEHIKRSEVLRFKLFQIDFLSTLSGELLVSLLYHRSIGEEWIDAVKPLKAYFNIDIIGRSRKNKIVLDKDYVTETLCIHERNYHFIQTENSFTQPNAKVCEHMIEWAIKTTQDVQQQSDLIEFYCGNGNFTIPLAQNFRRVIATEISKKSVYAARKNCALNHIDNVSILRMPAADLVAVLNGEKSTRKVLDLELDLCDFQTVFVDPPRSGLDTQTLEWVSAYPVILYISCNPDTLLENLRVLSNTHSIEHIALFDQFPYTHHIETGVKLVRRS